MIKCLNQVDLTEKKFHKYICLCGNSIFANKNDLIVKCNAGHAGSIKMLCEEQWTKPDNISNEINEILSSWSKTS